MSPFMSTDEFSWVLLSLDEFPDDAKSEIGNTVCSVGLKKVFAHTSKDIYIEVESILLFPKGPSSISTT